MSGLSARAHGFVWGTVAVSALALWWVTQTAKEQNVWGGWRESGELRRPAYRERIYEREVFRTRANTWSNLGYIVVGLYGTALGWRDLREQKRDAYLVRTPALSLAFGAACCCLGIGSGLFHASLTRLGQQLDVASMYPPLMTMIAVGMGRWIPALRLRSRTLPTWPVLLVLVALASGLLYYFKWSMSSPTVLYSLVGSVATLTLLARFCSSRKLDGRWLAASSAALIVAVFCRQLDIAGRFSGPDAWAQGHALWHILTALSLGCVYAFYRSDADSEATPKVTQPSSLRVMERRCETGHAPLPHAHATPHRRTPEA